MIVKMHKYSFLVFHAEYARFLEDMKELGVLHILESKNEPTEDMLAHMKLGQEISNAIAFLQRRKPDEAKTQSVGIQDGAAVLDDIRQIQATLDQLGQQKLALEKDIRQFDPWGRFDWDSITRLKEAGIDVMFFQCAGSKFDPEWETKVSLSVVSDLRNMVNFVVFRHNNEELPEMDAEEVILPRKTLATLEQEMQLIDSSIADVNARLDQHAIGSIALLEKYRNDIKDNLQTEMAVLHTGMPAGGVLRQLEGFVPLDRVEDVDNWLQTKEVVYVSSEAQAQDLPPILLKNNAFSRLVEPVGKLFSLPAYVELDLTPFFAPFFMLFFGFCFGDAGYGLLLIFGGMIAKRKVDAKFKSLLSLLQWFGVATVIMGSLSGTLFGMKLTEFEWPAISNLQKMMLSDLQMFYLALILGFIQVMFGMMLKGVNLIIQEGFKYSISTWSWIVAILSSVAFYVMGGMMSVAHIVVLGICALGIFVFNHPRRNVFVNVGAGLWDTYNMVTGIAGDVLSYIRLFALGLSGGILGYVFNRLAFDLSPDIPVLNVIITALILIVGHSLNIFMSGLGAFVHPMRLIFVEFFKNSGFLGGGKAYSPFSKSIN